MIDDKKEKKKEQNRKAVRKYSEKTLAFAVKYYPTDIIEGKRLKKYLEDNGISANGYIKELIKADMDSKEVPYD